MIQAQIQKFIANKLVSSKKEIIFLGISSILAIFFVIFAFIGTSLSFLKLLNAIDSDITDEVQTVVREGFVDSGKPNFNPFGIDMNDVLTTQEFGFSHKAVDIVPSPSYTKDKNGDTTVYATCSGNARAGVDESGGLYVLIDCRGGEYTVLLLHQRINYITGRDVLAGEKIGIMGTTGNSTGDHVHYSIKRNGTYVDPEDFMGSGINED